MWPAVSIPMKASCAVSTISRARASLSARRAPRLDGGRTELRGVGRPERDVEHGADAARREVAFPKIAGPRIAVGVGGRDDALLFDCRKVVGRLRARQDSAAAELGRLQAIETLAADALAILSQPPQRQAARIERRGGQGEDGAQALPEAALRHGVLRRQRREGAALRRQPLFAGLEGPFGLDFGGDVLEDREDGGLAAKGDAPCRRRRPERAAAGPAQLEAEVVRPALAHDLLGHPAPLVRIHVIIGRVTADGLLLADTEHIGGALVDGQDAVIREPRDDSRKRTGVEQLEEEAVVSGD